MSTIFVFPVGGAYRPDAFAPHLVVTKQAPKQSTEQAHNLALVGGVELEKHFHDPALASRRTRRLGPATSWTIPVSRMRSAMRGP